MKIAVLGASGGIGALLVKQATDRGHDVVAVGRSSSKVAAGDRVSVRQGALDDAAFLAQALAGCDAVASGLGLKVSGLSPFATVEDITFLRRSSAAIVDAMKQSGVRRIVLVSAGGVGDSFAFMPGVFKAILKTTSMRKVYPELDAMEQTFFQSGLDACAVRPSGLTDGPKTGNVRVVKEFKGRAMISRADVAAYMLDLLEKPAFSERAPVITVEG